MFHNDQRSWSCSPVLSGETSSFTPGVSQRSGSASTFQGMDRLGTFRVETNASQSVTGTRQYDAFGNPTATTGTPTKPFGFAAAWGYQQDPDSSLMLLGHRYYDPTTGRFLTRDPAKDGRNWYGYGANNPLSRVDASGLAWWEVIFKGRGKDVIYHVVEGTAGEVFDHAEGLRPGGELIMHHEPRFPVHLHNVDPASIEAKYTEDAVTKIHVTSTGDADSCGGEWSRWRDKATFYPNSLVLPIFVLFMPGDFFTKGQALEEILEAVVSPYVNDKQQLRESQMDWWLSDETETPSDWNRLNQRHWSAG